MSNKYFETYQGEFIEINGECFKFKGQRDDGPGPNHDGPVNQVDDCTACDIECPTTPPPEA
jgi:hypothetical protein